MGQEVKIGNRKVGRGYEPYIICEISANHNGKIENAKELITVAASSGCDAIKLQTYTPDTMTIDHNGADFLINGGLWDGYKLYDLYSEAQTPFEWHGELFSHARNLGVEIFSTPFDKSAADLLEELGSQAYKIASFELTDLPLIRYVAKKGKPIILSTGLASLSEIETAVNAVNSQGNDQIILLHCISSYPTPVAESNIKTVRHLSDTFDVVAGLSDHTLTNAASIASIALGGSVIEKHFTLRRADGGADATFSLEPHEFERLVAESKDAWLSLGKVNYSLKESEKQNMKFRRSIYFINNMDKGSIVTPEDIRIIRPGFGLPPDEIEKIIGRRLRMNVTRGQATAWNQFCD